ncbi:hypothetical protein ACHAXS_009827 [Conticribra weissflogii]
MLPKKCRVRGDCLSLRCVSPPLFCLIYRSCQLNPLVLRCFDVVAAMIESKQLQYKATQDLLERETKQRLRALQLAILVQISHAADLSCEVQQILHMQLEVSPREIISHGPERGVLLLSPVLRNPISVG